METITLRFPDNSLYNFELGKPIVLIGANGSGKTRFSVKIEELNDKDFSGVSYGKIVTDANKIHRLSAQKSLTIENSISVSDYESAEQSLYIGRAEQQGKKTFYRYLNKPVTHMINDYSAALSFLFSKENKELQEAHAADRKAVESQERRPDLITTIVEKATRIWNDLLPHRKIDLSGNGVHVLSNDVRYHGQDMSDGERVILYMICQALLLPPKSVLIVDEPELHIHKTIVNELWTALERERTDCVFMYITHDIDFALSRENAEMYWIKSYNGTGWDYEKVDADNLGDLPNELLFEILGSRKKILFIEGEKSSYDYRLFKHIYEPLGYHIMPCGSCNEVIKYVKSKPTYEALSAISIYGIIDRDYRSEQEIESLKADGVFCLDVAEIENLFIVPEVLDIMEKALCCDEGTSNKAQRSIMETFASNKDNQISKAFLQEIQYQLSLFNDSARNLTPEVLHQDINECYSLEKLTEIHDKIKQTFDNATDVENVLRVFNFKGLLSIISSAFGLQNGEYIKKVFNILQQSNEYKQPVLEAINKYIPELP